MRRLNQLRDTGSCFLTFGLKNEFYIGVKIIVSAGKKKRGVYSLGQ